MFDLLVAGGTVIDGTGAERFRADVGVRDGRIAAVGDLKGESEKVWGSGGPPTFAEAKTTIDARDLVVAPGFIDVHNHSDGWLLNTPNLLPKTTQGFTTEVIAADGISYAPVDETTARQWMFYLRSLNGLRMEEYRGWRSLGDYLDAIAGGTAQNVAAHVPYANVRSLHCGFGRGAPDDFQMRSIRADIRRGLEEGAVGLSTGLDYLGQNVAGTDELVEACAAMADLSGLYVTHIRYKKGLLPALREAVEIARRANVPLHVSHLKAHSREESEAVLGYIDQTARREVDFSFDVYPYQPGSTMLNYLLPYEVWEDGPLAALGKLDQPEMRARFRRGLETYRLELDEIRIAWTHSGEHQGVRLLDYVGASGRPAEDAILDLLIEERLAVLLVFDEGDDRLAEPFLNHDLGIVATDGIYAPGGQVHPRMFGSVGRVLGPLVRDRKVFSLEEAVAKLSGRPADRFGLRDRGAIRQGAAADLVLFDPGEITDRATYDDPQQPTEGVAALAINGVPVLLAASPVESLRSPLPGQRLFANRKAGA